MNHFKMKPTTLYCHLGGMGCATSVSSLDLGARLLRSFGRPATCLVVTHENITTGLYMGTDRSYLLGNALFRLGGAAALLTTDHGRFPQAKYVLEHSLRTVTSKDDFSYSTMNYRMDGQGNAGVFLPPAKTIIQVSGDAIRTHLTKLGTSEYLSRTH